MTKLELRKEIEEVSKELEKIQHEVNKQRAKADKEAYANLSFEEKYYIDAMRNEVFERNFNRLYIVNSIKKADLEQCLKELKELLVKVEASVKEESTVLETYYLQDNGDLDFSGVTNKGVKVYGRVVEHENGFEFIGETAEGKEIRAWLSVENYFEGKSFNLRSQPPRG